MVRDIYSGFLCLSFMFLVSATYICICLLGYCTEEWLPWNLVMGSVAEATFFVWGIIYIKRGRQDIFNVTHSLKSVEDLYVRVSFLMGFGIVFAIIMLVFPYNVCPSENNAILVFSLNIVVPALFFLGWMIIGITKIRNLMNQ